MIEYTDDNTGEIYLFPFLSGQDIDSLDKLESLIEDYHPYIRIYPPKGFNKAFYYLKEFQSYSFSIDDNLVIKKSLARVKKIFQKNNWLDS